MLFVPEQLAARERELDELKHEFSQQECAKAVAFTREKTVVDTALKKKEREIVDTLVSTQRRQSRDRQRQKQAEGNQIAEDSQTNKERSRRQMKR